MADKRKDNKGRNLKTGEVQRKDLMYVYRYTDIYGKRHSIYSSSLQELRKKEVACEKDKLTGDNYIAGRSTVGELIERYYTYNCCVRDTTKIVYKCAYKLVQRNPFSKLAIRKIKTSDAKKFLIDLNKSGYAYNTIFAVKTFLRKSFEMAKNDNLISGNPFDFPMPEIMTKTAKKREALTQEQQDAWFDFIKHDDKYNYLYDEHVILLGTGLRVSELAGLTIDDLDLKNRKITVNKQLTLGRDSKLTVVPPKSSSGYRTIPISEEVLESFQNILEKRPTLLARKKPPTETVIDDVSGFVFLNKCGRPKSNQSIEWGMKQALRKYNEDSSRVPIECLTPHVLRHTYCTNMAKNRIDPKVLQYLMGHASISITMDVYTHIDQDYVVQETERILHRETLIEKIKSVP